MTSFIKLGVHGALIAGVLGIVALVALNIDSTGATLGHFTTGGIDLQIDSKSVYNGVVIPGSTWSLKNLVPTADKFFNYDDIKPGDFGCETISMHVKKGNAWLCLDFKNLKSNENGMNEPESLIPDPNGNAKGELADNLQFFGWIDNSCDGKFKNGEKVLFGTSTKAASTVLASTTYPIGDSKSGGSCRSNETRCASMCWCAGTLTVDMNTGKMTCDGSHLGNIAQTDSMNIDVSIRALESTSNSQFLCNPPPPPPPPPPSCEKDKWGNWKDQYGKSCKMQYCSPGYWKQSQHFDNWVNYSPNTQFSAVFDNAFPGKTLLQVLQQGGGGLNELGRYTVDALLNAGKLNNFPYTQAQVIAMFNAAYPGSSSTYSALVDKFNIAENCPLN